MEHKSKFIVGKIIPNKTKKATIKVFDSIDYWSKSDFISEFKYLESSGVEEVDILINSIGGSVTDGLSIYSEIERSSMKCTTIIEGVAMSMGSIIWAAGDKLKMRDYGILMLHNPSSPYYDEEDDEDLKEMLSKFKSLLKTIYCKRFNLTSEDVDKIMDGRDGVDGTYYLAHEAVEAGFIAESDVIKTKPIGDDEDDIYNIFASSQKKGKVKCARIVAKAVMDKYDVKNIKQPKTTKNSIINQNAKEGEPSGNKPSLKKENKKIMENKSIFAVALGLSADASEKDVMNTINALKDVQAKSQKLEKEKASLLKDIEAKKTEITGYKTSIENLKQNEKALTEELSAYKKKEEEARKEEIERVVDKAIEDKKIKAEAKETWVNLAVKDFEQVKNMLDSIEAVTVQPITEQIAGNKDGAKQAEANAKTEAERISALAMEKYGIANK